MSAQILKTGELNGEVYRLERRVVYQRFHTQTVYVIADFAGELYAFTARDPAEHEWASMGIRALAKQEAA